MENELIIATKKLWRYKTYREHFVDVNMVLKVRKRKEKTIEIK